MPRLDYVMQGIKRHQAKAGVGFRTRHPVTPSLLRKLKGVWSVSGGERDTKFVSTPSKERSFAPILSPNIYTTLVGGTGGVSYSGRRHGKLLNEV